MGYWWFIIHTAIYYRYEFGGVCKTKLSVMVKDTQDTPFILGYGKMKCWHQYFLVSSSLAHLLSIVLDEMLAGRALVWVIFRDTLNLHILSNLKSYLYHAEGQGGASSQICGQSICLAAYKTFLYVFVSSLDQDKIMLHLLEFATSKQNEISI